MRLRNVDGTSPVRRRSIGGIAQVAIDVVAVAAAGVCTFATAGACAGLGGVLICAAIGAAANIGKYEIGAGEHTLAGASETAAWGIGEYGGAAFVGKVGMLGATTSKSLTFGDMIYNIQTDGWKFTWTGENRREVANHLWFGTRVP
jgi:hypothetical protein